MSMRGTWSRCALVIALSSLQGWLPVASWGAGTDAYDCGARALYTMLRLHGRAVDLQQIAAVLPPPSPNGHTMSELRRASERLGLPMTGLRLNARASSLDRPILLFFKDGDHGHYVVGRSVGHTGTLFQVIDSNQPVYVIDKAELIATPKWTGFALVESGSLGVSFSTRACVLSASLIAVFFLLRRSRYGGRRPLGVRPPHQTSTR